MENIHGLLSGKMWQELFQAIKDKISEECLKKSQKAIFQCLIVENGQIPVWLETGKQLQLGECWMLNTGECPNVERESTLYTILMENVPDKYYLSGKACAGILRRAKQRGKKLPEILEMALQERVWEQSQKPM